MRIVVEYMLKEFWKYFLLLLGIFTFIYVLIDFLDHIGLFIEHRATASLVVSYYAYRTPFIVLQMSAISVLLSIIILLSIMHRHNEITALKASGVSAYRLSLPLVLAALFITLLTFILAEGVVPKANVKSLELMERQIRKPDRPGGAATTRFKSWYRAERAIYYVRRFPGQPGVIEGISLYFFDDRFRLTRRVDARRGVFQDGVWTFYRGADKTIGPKGEFKAVVFDRKQILLQAKPEDFAYEEKTVDQMSLAELNAFIAKLKREGYETTYFEIDRQVKFSLPFVCTVLALIGIPLTLRQEREAGMARAAALGVVAAFLYLAFFAVSRSLGHSETLPIALAAWLPNLVFGLTGAYLLVTLHQ